MEGVVPAPVGVIVQPKRKLDESGGESALHANGGILTDRPPGGNDAVGDDADPETKRRRTEVGPPSLSAPQPASDASTPAPIVSAPPAEAPQAQGALDAPSAAPDGQPGTSTNFATAAASAIAAAAASSSGAASAASQPPNKVLASSASVPSSGTAPAPSPMGVEGNDEDEDGEYDPTASPYVPSVQVRSIGPGVLERGPETRPTADQGIGESLKLEQVAPSCTAEVLTMTQPNVHSSVEVGGPPVVNEQAAPLEVKNEASTASAVLPESSTTAETASVVAAPPPVATGGAAGSDAVTLGAVGTERSAALLPGSSAPATTLSPEEPQPVSGAPPAPVNVEEPLPSPPGVVSASVEANVRPHASTPPSSSVTETEIGADTEASQAVQPPSPPICSSSGQKPLPESAEVESEDDEEEDGPPNRPVLPLPDKPALPSALKSRPPTTSLLPPTSASRAAQGPRKRVQWASEVASVALIENRPQLAEMWDTGPDAAEMPSQLLTPSPTPQGGDSLSAFEMAKKKERDSEQERMRAAKAALWTRLDRMAADIAYQTPPRLVLIPAGCESYDAAVVMSPHRDEVERQRRVAPSAEIIPDPRRFRSPPSPPLHSWTGPDDDAEVPVIPLDDVMMDQAGQPSEGSGGHVPAAAAGISRPLADPAASSSGPMSALSSGAPGASAALHEPHRVGADGGANGVREAEAAQIGSGTASPGTKPAVLSAGQALESAGISGNEGSSAGGSDVGGGPGAGREGANRVSSLLGGLDLGKLQQLLGATNSLIGQQQRQPDDPFVAGQQPLPPPPPQQLLPPRQVSQPEPATASDPEGYVPSAQGGQLPPAPHNPLAPPPGGEVQPSGLGGPAAKNPAAQLSALLQLLTSQSAGSAGAGGPPLAQQPPPQMHGPPPQQPPPSGMCHNGGAVGAWGPGGGGGPMPHQMSNVHGAPMQQPPGMSNMHQSGMGHSGMPPPPHGRGGQGMGGQGMGGQGMGGQGMGGPAMGGGMPPSHGMGPGGPHGMRSRMPPPGVGYPTGGQQSLPVVHFRHGQVHGDMGRGGPSLPPGGFDGGRSSGSRGGASSQRGGGGVRRVNKPKNRVKCLFFNTLKGCRSGDACEYIHEPPGGGGDVRVRYASHR